MHRLPDGFEWNPRSHLDELPTGLFLDGRIVVSMLARIDGSWVARLHLDDRPDAPLLMRDCRSFESGRRGAELWAIRHETTLRANVAKAGRRPPPPPAKGPTLRSVIAPLR